MASIHRERRSPFWYAAFYNADGRRSFKSTGTKDRNEAMRVALEWSDAAKEGRNGTLTEHRIRKTMADIFMRANREKMPAGTVAEFLNAWLQAKELEVSESSLPEYRRSVATLIESLGTKADRPIDAVTRKDALAYRGHLAQRVGPASVNKMLRILRGAWTQAREASLTVDNIFPSSIELKEKSGKKRRPLTMPELKKVLGVCDDEWRGMVLLGLYTGQRLGDLAGLTWGNVDLDKGAVAFTTTKTDRPMEIPLAEPLLKYLIDRPSADTPDAPVLPGIHATLASGGSGTLSRQFSEILARAGLIEKKAHRKTGKGRDARRTSGGLSFHCLRHTATSLLKNAGVSDVVAREIVGHESEAVSRIYTHLEPATLRKAVATMPDVTK
jgi:integrase